MDLSFITNIIVTILLLPMQFILYPIDLLLNQIPGLDVIPQAINNVVSIVGTAPSLIVSMFGIQPLIWNAFFLTFVLFIGLAPAIQVLKNIWAWIRP